MRAPKAAWLAKAAAWTLIPVAAAEPIASSVFSAGMWGLSVVEKLTVREALTSLPSYLWYYPGSASVQYWAMVSIPTAALVVAAPTLYLAYAFHLRRQKLRPARPGQKAPEPERADSRVHGDARWMTMEEAHEAFPGGHEDWGGVTVAEAYDPHLDGTARPFDEGRPETWGQGGKAALLITPLTTAATSGIIIAGAGSYKTMAFIVPNMVTYRGACVVNDPKVKVGALVRGVREQMGHQVALVNPANPAAGGFNVLDCIDTSDPMAIVHAIEFVDWGAMAGGDEKKSEGGDNKMFIKSAKELQICLLADLLWDTDLPRSRRNVIEWRRRLVIPEMDMQPYLRKIYANTKSDTARDYAATLMRIHPKTFTGIYKGATSDTEWLSIRPFADLLSGGAFDPAALTGGKLTVILQIPDEVMKSRPAVGRVILGSLARTVLRAEGRTATPVPFFLDEMEYFKHMPILETLRDMGRECRAPVFPIWQSTGQIEKTWGKDGKKSWFASAAWRMYAMVEDQETAAEVSARCGSYTAFARSEGDSTTTQSAFSNGQRSRGRSANVSEQSVPLISEYDLQSGMRPDEAILIPRGQRALRCGRALPWRRPEMALALGMPAPAPTKRKRKLENVT